MKRLKAPQQTLIQLLQSCHLGVQKQTQNKSKKARLDCNTTPVAIRPVQRQTNSVLRGGRLHGLLRVALDRQGFPARLQFRGEGGQFIGLAGTKGVRRQSEPCYCIAHLENSLSEKSLKKSLSAKAERIKNIKITTGNKIIV